MTPSNRPSSASRHTRALPLLASFHSCAAASSRWSRQAGMWRASYPDLRLTSGVRCYPVHSVGPRLLQQAVVYQALEERAMQLLEVVSLLLDPTPSQRPDKPPSIPPASFRTSFARMLGGFGKPLSGVVLVLRRTPSSLLQASRTLRFWLGLHARILGIVRGDLLVPFKGWYQGWVPGEGPRHGSFPFEPPFLPSYRCL